METAKKRLLANSRNYLTAFAKASRVFQQVHDLRSWRAAEPWQEERKRCLLGQKD